MFRIDKKYVSMPDKNPEDAGSGKNTAAGGNIHAPGTHRRPETAEQALTEAAKIVEEARVRADDIIKKAMEKAEEEAVTRIKMNRLEAEAIVEDARVQAETIAEFARKEGYRQGLQQAEEENRLRFEEDKKSVDAILEEMHRAQRDFTVNHEKEILGIILALAKKIINAAVQVDDVMYESMITNALHQMKRSGKITVYVSPKDYKRFLTPGSASYILDGEKVAVRIVEDADIKQGGLLLESDLEVIDAGIDTQLKKIELAFNELSEDTDGH